jgi:uracil-DNA glycosylase
LSKKDELQALYEDYMIDERFEHFRDLHKNFVPGMGPLSPKLMLVGEAPGRMENAKRLPFVGQAGINLANLLEDVGIDQYNVFMTNVLKYWPPYREGGYTPSEEDYC